MSDNALGTTSDADQASLPRLKILFPEGSSTSARQALYELGPHHDIDIIDPSALCQCRFSSYVRRWYRCPSFTKDPAGYLSFLLDRIEAGQYDVLLPSHEQIYLLSRVQQRLDGRVAMAVPPFAAVDQLMSKANFARLLDELGLPQPELTIVSHRHELEQIGELPRFLKLDYSTAGQGVRLVRDRGELARAIDEFDRAGWLAGDREILVQKPGVGRKASIKSVFQQGSLVAAHCAETRAFGIGGSSVAEASTRHPVVVEHMASLGAHLGWHGAMAVEYFHQDEGSEPQYLECNPRIGETGGAWLSGVKLCEQLLRVSRGTPLAAQPVSRQDVQTHQAFLVLLSRAVDGSGRKELLTELWRSLRSKGLYADSQDVMTRPGEDMGSSLPALWVTLRLLLRPSAAQGIVRRTVDNYSLSSAAADQIRQLS